MSSEPKRSNHRLNAFAVILLIAVVSVPLAYSATEPSVIINMLVGQTEKPIQVKASNGTEVFSVDVDGTVFPDPTFTPSDNLTNLGDRLVMLTHTQSTEATEVFTSATVDNDDARQIVKWRIDFDDTNVDYSGGTGSWGNGAGVFIVSQCTTGYFKGSVGTFDIRLIQSADDIDYGGVGAIQSVGTNLTTYEADDACDSTPVNTHICVPFGTSTRSIGGSSTCYLALAIDSSSIQTVNYKGYQFDTLVFLPDGATITQVLP